MCIDVGLLFVFFFFFFSSRRRHTRLVSDWSSDVCSSDLGYIFGEAAIGLFVLMSELRVMSAASASSGVAPATARSEERRVGKECRCRWSRDHYRKKNR